MSKRPYQQRLRAQAAEQTRDRILDALYDRLREAPSAPISVDEIANRAGVARSTIYLDFGSRSGLFDALTDRLLRGAGHERIVEAVADPDARASLRGGLEGGVRMYAAHHDVFRVLSSMAKLDPDGVGRAIASAEERRAAGMATLARRLRAQKLLRPGLTATRAAHIFWIFASFDAYDLLATGRGLAPDEIIELRVEGAEHSLLAEV